MTFNPYNAKPGDGQPMPPDALIAVAPDGSGLIYIPASSAFPSLHDRLMAVVKEARDAGYAVVVLYPEELIGVDNEALQVYLTRTAKAYIDVNLEPDPEE